MLNHSKNKLLPDVKKKFQNGNCHSSNLSQDSVSRKKSFECFLKETYNDIAAKYTFLSSQQIKKRVLDMWKKMSHVPENAEKSEKASTKKLHFSTKRTVGKNNNFTEESRNSLKPSLKSKTLVPLKVNVLPAPVKGSLKSGKKTTTENKRVSFNNEPEVRYRTASETSSTSTLKSLHIRRENKENAELHFNSKTNSRSYSHRFLKAKRDLGAESQIDRKFDDLLNEKCSWSYKTIKTFNCTAQRNNNDPIFQIQSTIETVNIEKSIYNTNHHKKKTYLPNKEFERSDLSKEKLRGGDDISNEEFERSDSGVRDKCKNIKSSTIVDRFKGTKQHQRKNKIQTNRNTKNSRIISKPGKAKVKTNTKMNRPKRNISVVKYTETDAESQQSSSDDGIVLQSRIFNMNNDQDESNDNFSDHSDDDEILETNSPDNCYGINSKNIDNNLDKYSDYQTRNCLTENINNDGDITVSPQFNELADNLHPEEDKQTNLGKSFVENKITERKTLTSDTLNEFTNINPGIDTKNSENKILKNKDLEYQIFQQYQNVSSEVQSICNELETPKSNLGDEIEEDFSNGTFDVEKYRFMNFPSKIISQNEYSDKITDNGKIEFEDKNIKRENLSSKRITLKRKSQEMNEKFKTKIKNSNTKIEKYFLGRHKLDDNHKLIIQKEDDSNEFSKSKTHFKKKNQHSKLNEPLIQKRYQERETDSVFDNIREKDKEQRKRSDEKSITTFDDSQKVNLMGSERSISDTLDASKESQISRYQTFSETGFLRKSEFYINFEDETKMSPIKLNESRHIIKSELWEKGSLHCNDYEDISFNDDYKETFNNDNQEKMDFNSKNKLHIHHTKSSSVKYNSRRNTTENKIMNSNKKDISKKIEKTRSLSIERDISDSIKCAESNLTNKSKKQNPKTWEDLKAEIFTDDVNGISPALDLLSQEQFMDDAKSKTLKKTLQRNIKKSTDYSDIESNSSDSSFNIEISEQDNSASFTKIKSISSKIAFNSPNADIVQKVIMKMKQCTAPLSLTSKTKEYNRSSFPKEYSYSIQETQSMCIMTEKASDKVKKIKNSDDISTVSSNGSQETSMKLNKPRLKTKDSEVKKLNKTPNIQKKFLEFQFNSEDEPTINDGSESARKTSKSSNFSSSQDTVNSSGEKRYNLRKRTHSNTVVQKRMSNQKNKPKRIRNKDISKTNYYKKTKYDEFNAYGEISTETFVNEIHDKNAENLTAKKLDPSKGKFKSRNEDSSSNKINVQPNEDIWNIADELEFMEDLPQEKEINYKQNKDLDKSNSEDLGTFEDSTEMPSDINELSTSNSLKEKHRDVKTQGAAETVKEIEQSIKKPKYEVKKINNSLKTLVKEKKEKNNSKEEYEKYLKKLFNKNILETSEENQKFLNDGPEISQKMLITDSDEELSSLSSLNTDSEEEQPSQKRAAGLLDDLFD
ncbi:uncharacterized protein TNCT_222911 [Trichonephila clavata]|uniref:Uncharacterized protein n=1 Tax=Trichonephila clavata TaxID=2740835 RepID=A0A8X6K246_TRICU|nr:uncharacterized protein TNCT_222911 [Trichonephila clavata]